jgi:hypothetical protein
MTYTQQGDHVTLDMTREVFEQLVWVLGVAAGVVSRERGFRKEFWELIRLANELNTGNPNWKPYDVPEEETTV